MTEPTPSPRSPAPAVKREFAFSRVAGVSPTEYAAVSSSAVLALIVSMFSFLGLVWLWGLAAPLIALLLALLSLYYIATSAGTLTGRKVALAAVGISLVVGVIGAGRQYLAWRQEQADIAEVRGLAGKACGYVLAGDYDSLYQQVGPDFRTDVPLGYWHYEWSRFFELRGAARRVELSARTLVQAPGQILVTMKIYLDDPLASAETGPPAQRVVGVQLLYARPGALGQHEPSQGPPIATRRNVGPQPRGAQAGDWQLVRLPDFINPLPPPYLEPLVWPAPGKTLTVDLDKAAGTTTQLDLPPLVPPNPGGAADNSPPPQPWLPIPPPPKIPEHHHH